MKFLQIYCTLCLIIFPGVNLAQDEFQSFDRQEWRELTKDINYSASKNNKKKEANNKRRGDQRGRLDENPVNTSSGGAISLFSFGGIVFQIILVVLVIIILVMIVSKLMGGSLWIKTKKVHKQKESEVIDNLEENLMESDLMKWLRKAVDDRNYRLAIRIYYLIIIQELANTGLIQWKKEKTNLEYVYEMRGHTSHQAFEEITSVYQLVWYGEKEMEDETLIQASHKFKDYFQSINSFANG